MIEEGSDLSLINQFYVGFFSAFLIADKVVVTSKHDDNLYIWEREADKNFIIRKDESYSNLICGTNITIYVREDLGKILEEKKISDLINKHSKFFGYPINLHCKKTKDGKVDEDEFKTGDEEKVAEVKDDNKKKKRRMSQQSNINVNLSKKQSVMDTFTE
jgi:molecular chaperone HtpG